MTYVLGALASNSSAVMKSQQFLKTFGFDPGSIDGVAGQNTMSAQLRFANSVLTSCQAGGGVLGTFATTSGFKFLNVGDVAGFQNALRTAIKGATPGTDSYNKANDFLQYDVIVATAGAGSTVATLPSVPPIVIPPSAEKAGVNPVTIFLGLGLLGVALYSMRKK